jgi:hypothetical protein
MRVTCGMVCLAVALLAGSEALGQSADFEREKQALALIPDCADRLCTKVPLTGSVEKREPDAGAKAELKGLASAIARLGFEGAAKVENGTDQGLLQADLEAALKDNTECRREVWGDLKDRLLGARPPPEPVDPTPPTPGAPEPSATPKGGTYPIQLAAGGSAKAAHARYMIRSAELDQHSTAEMVLKLEIRFTNDGDAFVDRTVSDDNFRLLIDGAAFAPSESLNETVATGSTKDGTVEFLVPVGTASAILRVGRPGYGTSEIPIDLRTTD